MTHRLLTAALQGLLLLAVAVVLFLQVVGLPWLGGEVARDLTAEAYMRWPITILAIVGLAFVQLALLATVRLLGLTRSERIFTPRALPWVDAIIVAFLGSALTCAATIGYQAGTVPGPPLWFLMLVAGVAVGLGLALLMLVMRSLLTRATALSTELDGVI